MTVSMREMLEAGVHFGHQTRFWNPKMAQYIFGSRNKIHIINLEKTLAMYNDAMKHIRQLASNKGTILMVGTKRQAREIIAEEAKRAGVPYVDARWLGGMLTNFKTVKASIKRLKEMEIIEQEGGTEKMTKKEALMFKREKDKLNKAIGGIKDLNGLPDAIFVIDVGYHKIAITEATKLGIPLIAVVDTNHSPDGIAYVIPGNDDSSRAIRLYARGVADAILEGRAQVINELVAAGDGLHHFVGGVGLAFEHGVGHGTSVQRHRLGRVVVARDDVVDVLRRVVGVDDADDRNAELLGLGDRDLVVADVDDEDRVGQRAHVLDAADVLLELGQLALEHQRFLLDHGQRAGILLGLHVLQLLQRTLDRLEVGQHAAEPALVDEGHAGALGLQRDHVARLALRADHQDGAALGGQLSHELHRFLELRQRLFEVDDVDLVAMAVDERGHLGVPEAGLVSEMDTGFQHFAHGHGHGVTPKVGSRIPAHIASSHRGRG